MKASNETPVSEIWTVGEVAQTESLDEGCGIEFFIKVKIDGVDTFPNIGFVPGDMVLVRRGTISN